MAGPTQFIVRMLMFATVGGVAVLGAMLLHWWVQPPTSAELMILAASESDPIALERHLGSTPINATDSLGNSALSYAARAGNLHGINRLLDAGADINQANHHGWTPLMHAVAARQKESVRLLLRRGADPFHRDRSGHCAADVATNFAANDLLELLEGPPSPHD